jgi:hypothetical protein
MADDRGGPPPERNRGSPPSRSLREERPFDTWVDRQLHAMYDDIAREPLPADLVSLIERHGRETASIDEATVDPAGERAPPTEPASDKND